MWVAGQSAGAHILSLALIERAAKEHRDREQSGGTMSNSVAAGESTATLEGAQQQQEQPVEEGHKHTAATVSTSSTFNARTASNGTTRTTK